MRTFHVEPGRLRHELSLQSAVSQPDGLGGAAETWTETTKLFAAIEPVAAAVAFGADQSLETVTHRILLRRRDDVRSGMRLVNQNRIFEILALHDPDESGRYLVCAAKETGR